MSRQVAKGLLIANFVLLVFNIFMHYTTGYDPQYFELSIQLTVAVLLAVSWYLFKNPSSVKWFKNLEGPSDVNDTISFVFSIICHIPILIFNLGPLFQKFGP
jgi:hypothetical protein